MCETALYWRCMPKKTLATDTDGPSSGTKELKDRVTVFGCSGAAGMHKCKLMVTGKSVNPRAFKGVKIFPVIYRGNKKGWITTNLCLEWFEKYFVPEARAHCTSVWIWSAKLCWFSTIALPALKQSCLSKIMWWDCIYSQTVPHWFSLVIRVSYDPWSVCTGLSLCTNC